MSGKQARNILLGLIALGLIIFLAIGFVGVSKIEKKSQSMVDLKLKSAKIDAQLINLSQAKKDVEKYKSFNDIAASVIPKDKNQVQAIADIFQIAQETGISLQSVVFPVSTLGSKAVVPPPSADKSAVSQNTSTQSAISQAKPYAAVPGLYSLELTITPKSGENVPTDLQVTYSKFINFLSAIENNRRTAQVTMVTIQPVTTPNTPDLINFTLTLNIFIKP